MKYKTYKKYKPSGIEWLGEIPEEWEVKRLKFTCAITTGNKDTENNNPDGAYPFFVRSDKIESIDSYCFDGEGVLTAGDGVGVGKVFHYINGKFDFHQRVYLFYKFNKILGIFFYNYLKVNLFNEVIKLSAKTTVDSIRLPMLQNLIVVYPKQISEQKAIAEFLDRETAKIDTLISHQEKLIELLQEKRQALISHTVTKGIPGKNRKMKPSGIEWLGEIPDEWEVTKIKFKYEVKLGKMLQPNPRMLSDKLKPYLRAVNLDWKGINLEDVNLMWFSTNDLKTFKLKKDDLLISEGGDVGRSCFWKDELEECYFQNAINRVRQIYDSIFFLYYYIYTIKYNGLIDIICNKSTIAHFTAEKLNDTSIPLPPLSEQKAIADFLDRETSKIDALIEKAKQSIELSKEKRQALISSAVTGKIDVRGV